jgi:hypothetical protein
MKLFLTDISEPENEKMDVSEPVKGVSEVEKLDAAKEF